MATLLSGEWRLAPGRLILLGEFAGAFGVHHHPAVQVTLALQGQFVVANQYGGCTARAVVIPSGARHSLTPCGPSPRALSIYLHPASADGRRLLAARRPSRVPSDWAAAAHHIVDHQPDPNATLVTQAADVIATLLGPSATHEPVHPALHDAFAMLGAALPRKLHLRDLASSLSLSESKLSRLFLRETGASYLSTVRWHRLLRALVAVEAGGNLTDAAHAAGFTDSAHATRVCREMAGASPSQLLGSTRRATHQAPAAGRAR